MTQSRKSAIHDMLANLFNLVIFSFLRVYWERLYHHAVKNHFGFIDSNVFVTMLYWVLHFAFHVPRLLSKASETNKSEKTKLHYI